MNAFLIVGTKRINLTNSQSWTIGRHADNELFLQDSTASRKHAQIQITTQGFIVTDLGSRNGIMLNKKLLTNPTVLRDGDELLIGSTVIQFKNPLEKEDYSKVNVHEYQTQVIHERRLMTILVIDIKGYTPLTRQINEEVLAQLMSTWNTFCGSEVVFAGSWTHKFIGDAMMAVWLHEKKPSRDEVKNILQALNKIRHFTSSLKNRFNLPVDVRIGAGINTGYGMVGNNGSSNSHDFTPIGDTVNAAFRYESSTRTVDAELLIGNTFNYLGNPKPTLFKDYNLYLKGYEELKHLHGCSFNDLEQFLQVLTE